MTAASSEKSRVLLVSTGGTITMTPGASGGVTPTLTGEDLVRAVPALQDYATVDVHSYSTKPGASLTIGDLLAIAALLDKAFEDPSIKGAVVVQGTDTIEETAYLLDLAVRSSKPVVVTGAMRSATMPGADGAANLLGAVITAVSPQCSGRGAMVVLDDEIHRARFVQKTDTAGTGAFKSPGIGPMGRVIENQVVLYGAYERTVPLSLPLVVEENAVALVKVGLGDDGRLLRAVPELGYKGVVIEAMGAGHLPSHFPEIIGELLRVMPVVLATRVPAGPIFRKTYSFPGSEMDVLGRGALPAGTLGSLRARLLLSLLLSGGSLSRKEVEAAFLAHL